MARGHVQILNLALDDFARIFHPLRHRLAWHFQHPANAAQAAGVQIHRQRLTARLIVVFLALVTADLIRAAVMTAIPLYSPYKAILHERFAQTLFAFLHE